MRLPACLFAAQSGSLEPRRRLRKMSKAAGGCRSPHDVKGRGHPLANRKLSRSGVEDS
jgi:hypothetical protein